MNESHAGLRRLTEALHALGVSFLIGGSLASSVHGVPRATMGVDLVVDMTPGQIQSLADALNAEFYADAAALETSGRQWDDVLGVIRTAQGRLDRGYLHHWSSHLGVLYLLERAFAEAS